MLHHRVGHCAFLVVLTAALAFPAFAHAAEPPLVPALSEEFSAFPSNSLRTTFSSSGVWGPGRGTATSLPGGVALTPGAARGASALYTDSPAITSLPARVTFKVRYPQAGFRVARLQVYTGAPFTAAGATSGAPRVVDWTLGTTLNSTLAWPVQLRASYAGRLDGPYRDPSPVVPADQWLEGELYIASDTVRGTVNGQILTARHDFASRVASGLYISFLTSDDAVPRGVEFDYVRVEQATATAPNMSPVPAVSCPSENTVGDALIFDGTGSSDPDGFIASYTWDFGDGSTASGALASHTYSAPGTYRVALTVTDDDGASASTSTTVTVTSAAPTASILAPGDATVRQPVAFDGSGSSDPDGSIEDYSWDFGDGSTGTGPRPAHAFEAPGTYAVRLTVTDDSGLSATASTSITIRTVPPVAHILAPASQLVRLPVTFDGSGSSDPDGAIALYSWDFGDETTGSGATVKHAYSEPGTYTVILTVVDGDGTSASASAVVLVQRPEAGISALIAEVSGSSLSQGQKQKLLVELRAAQTLCAAGQPMAAAIELRKFITKLGPDKKVDAATKASWTTKALSLVKAMAIEAIAKPGKGLPVSRTPKAK